MAGGFYFEPAMTRTERANKRRAEGQVKREWRSRRDGSHGAASECRRIDPISGEVIGIVEPMLNAARKPNAS